MSKKLPTIAEIRESLPEDHEMCSPEDAHRLRLMRTKFMNANQAILDQVSQRGDDEFMASEAREVDQNRGAVNYIDGALDQAAERLNGAKDLEMRLGTIHTGNPLGGSSRSNGAVYHRGADSPSYASDMLRRSIYGDQQAAHRLDDHAGQVQRAMSRLDGAGGEFTPPMWIMDAYAAKARAGRVTADLLNKLPLPEGTDSLMIPRITTGSLTGMQTADNATTANQDMVTDEKTAPVRTISGYVDVAVQQLEQSPANFDEIVFSDLMSDHSMRVGTQVLSGTGATGQLLGLRNVTGINTVTYTDASPTMAELYGKLALAAQNVMTTRYLAPEAMVMHPRRWTWCLAQLDTNNRPFVVPTAGGAQNAGATAGDLNAQGQVGTMLGLPVYIDPNIPTDLGTGTDEDIIIVGRFSDSMLWESDVRTRSLVTPGSDSLSVRLQLYTYAAMTAERYPASITVVTGTGLNATL